MMKRIAGILLAIIIMPQVLPGQQADPDADEGYVTVRSNEPGLIVYLDDQKIGETPLTGYALTAGIHHLVVHAGAQFVWTDAGHKETISIEPGQTTTIDVDLSRPFRFDSTPYGADVLLNDVSIGKTPLRFKNPEPVLGTVRFKKNGYADRVLTIEPGTRMIHADLTIEPNFKKKLNENLNLEKEKTVDRRLLYSTLVLGTLSGAVAAYFKIEADDAAKKTERAADLGDLAGVQKYADRTDRYDLYSGIGFGVMQVNFIGLVYAVLK